MQKYGCWRLNRKDQNNMSLRVTFAILMCKITRFFLRVLRRGGTSLPGKIAEDICPALLKHLAKDVKCIAVTGTNGKTTSARMLEQLFIDSGAGFLSNKSGSNLMRGITTDFALNSTFSGKPKRQYAIVECDEAASKKVFEYLNPKVVLVTNVFNDQLDRFGSVEAILENIKQGVKNSPNAVVCLNADDPLTSSIADGISNKVVFFGLGQGVFDNNVSASSGARRCVRCNTQYEYNYRTYEHLGDFRCPSCGHARTSPDVTVTELIGADEDSQTVNLLAFGETSEVTINIPGEYNMYNAAGVVAAAQILGFSPDAVRYALQHFERGFGRMEKLELDGLSVRLILVKNTAGCNQALNYITTLTSDIILAFCLNDRVSDGADVSWINDVCFEKLTDIGGRLRGVLVSGTRADDMSRRLEAAGIPPELMRVNKDPCDMLSAALDAAHEQDAAVCILPTYSAMLELRAMICRRFGLKNYWE